MGKKHELLIDDGQLLILETRLAVLFGDREAIALQQVHFWMNINQKANKESHFFEDRWWAYSTWGGWKERDFPFWSVMTIRRIFEDLQNLKLLILKSHEGHNKGYWVTVDYDVLEQINQTNLPVQYEQSVLRPLPVQYEQSSLSNMNSPSVQNEQAARSPEITEESNTTDSPPTPLKGGEVVRIAGAPVPYPASTSRAISKESQVHRSPQVERRLSGKKSSLGAKKTREDTTPTESKPRSAPPMPRTPQAAKTKIGAFLEAADAFLEWWLGLTGRKEIQKDAWDLVNTFREDYESLKWRMWAEETITDSIEGSMEAYGKKARDLTLCDRLNNDFAYEKWLSQNHSGEEVPVVVQEDIEQESLDEIRQRSLDQWKDSDPEKYKLFSELWEME